MDAGTADTINRRDVARLVARLDALDLPQYGGGGEPWYEMSWATTLLNQADSARSAQAWIVAPLLARTPGVAFDGAPADCDWDNLFSHFRTAIQTRRDRETLRAHEVEIPVPDGVGSR